MPAVWAMPGGRVEWPGWGTAYHESRDVYHDVILTAAGVVIN
jgi:hypothetical protein